MIPIKHLSDLGKHLANQGIRKRIVVVWPSDQSTLKAIVQAIEEGWAMGILIGATTVVQQCNALQTVAQFIHTVEANSPQEAVEKAVLWTKEGQADVLMKGLINTEELIRAILNKENGLLSAQRVLTHVAVADIPTYHKLLFFTDSAVIPYPTPQQRQAQVGFIASLCHNFGIETPKISLIHCSEKSIEKHFPFTIHYAEIIEKAKQGVFGSCIIDGPLDVKVSCCIDSMYTKNIDSPLQGDADALIFPDIEAANTFYKTITLFANAKVSGVLIGTVIPIVLPSRGDDTASKYSSLALACTQ